MDFERIQIFFSQQFGRFLIVGGFAALVNLLSRILFDRYVSFSAAIILAYVVGMVTAFVLNRMFVFESSDRSTAQEIAYFVLVNIGAVVQTWLVSMALFYYLVKTPLAPHGKEVAHLVGVGVPVVTSFLGHKYLTFKRR